MSRSKLEGAGRVRKLLRRLPDASRAEMLEVLEDGARTVLKDMKAAVPVRTGALQRGLSIKVLPRSLRVKIGLFGKRTNSRLFYGRIIEFGFPAGSKLVERRRIGTSGLRNRRKKIEDIVARYTLHWKARPPRPFVFKRRGDIRRLIGRQLRAYWERALRRAGA